MENKPVYKQVRINGKNTGKWVRKIYYVEYDSNKNIIHEIKYYRDFIDEIFRENEYDENNNCIHLRSESDKYGTKEQWNEYELFDDGKIKSETWYEKM
nr:hypothetical protein [Treponema sp.]